MLDKKKTNRVDQFCKTKVARYIVDVIVAVNRLETNKIDLLLGFFARQLLEHHQHEEFVNVLEVIIREIKGVVYLGAMLDLFGKSKRGMARIVGHTRSTRIKVVLQRNTHRREIVGQDKL